MPDKTADHAKPEESSKHPVADAKAADKAPEKHAAKAPESAKPHIEAPEFPSPVPSSDPAAFWPEDGPISSEAPPRDQVWPPTDRQANQGQLAVPETYRTPDGYLVTKHPAAAAMVNKHARLTESHRAMGVEPRDRRSREAAADAAVEPSGDLDAQMESARANIRANERSIAQSRADLDRLLRHKNQNPK